MSAGALVVPWTRETAHLDADLVALAEVCGITVNRVPLDDILRADGTTTSASPHGDCLAVNGAVLRTCLSDDDMTPELDRRLGRRFPCRFVYGLDPDRFSAAVVRCFSGGRIHAVWPIPAAGMSVRVASDARPICDPFAGMAVGATERPHDRVLATHHRGGMRMLMHVDGRPFFAVVAGGDVTTFLLARRRLTDLLLPAEDGELEPHFAGVVPVIMALRAVFDERSFRPGRGHATLVIDDPLLRKTYGRLDYARLLGLMEAYDFHTTIAFIPYNRERTSPVVAQMFRDHPHRYSLCVHGNDHTGAEFGDRGRDALEAVLGEARTRMQVHQGRTGIAADEVMVFPQGVFGLEALRALRRHDYLAAVNSHARPEGEAPPLRVADLLAPAIVSADTVPLFLRRYVGDTTPARIAFDLFLGKPVLIAGHHDLFQAPRALLDLVALVRRVAPDVRWTSVGESVRHSHLARWGVDGELRVRAFASGVTIDNADETERRAVVEWRANRDIDSVWSDGTPCAFRRSPDGRIHADVPIGPRQSAHVRIRHRRAPATVAAPPTRRGGVRVYLRRRLSELRDEYLSRSPALLAAAARLRRGVGREAAPRSIS